MDALGNLADATAGDLLRLFRARKASPLEALDACVERISKLEPHINSVLTLCVDHARKAATEADRRWARGNSRPLEGIPYGLKDLIASAGIRTTGGSLLYADHVPAEDAEVTRRIDAAGGVLTAKLQTYEFALGRRGPYGITRNPWNLDASPGGSSSGPAAAIAARELPVAVGTDTGGSIRVPAMFCGITGLKPTFGRVSRRGVMPLSWTLDHVGPMARTVEDVALMMDAMAGHDPADPSSIDTPTADYQSALHAGLQGIRIGVPSGFLFDVCDPEVQSSVREAVEVLGRAGAEVQSVSLPTVPAADFITMGMAIIYPECASLHQDEMSVLDQFGPDFRETLISAQFVTALDYLRALRARAIVQADFQKVFEAVDAIIVPGATSAAPLLRDMLAVVGEQKFPWGDVISKPVAVFNLVGLPALAVPTGLNRDGLPVGMQIVAAPFAESKCIQIGSAYQQLTTHHVLRPPILAEGAA